MDKLSSLKAFLAVVDHGGFAAGARALGQSRSVVNRQVIALEDSLGVQLLSRNTRKVALTQTGAAYAERARAALAQLEAADLSVIAQGETPRGLVKVNAPMSFGMLHLGPAVADFLARFPEVEVQLQLDDRMVDPFEEGYDLTVRIAALKDSSLVARRIAPARRVLVASPDYLAARGRPSHPDALREHSCLHYGHLVSGAQWTLLGPEGPVAVAIAGRLSSNNGEALCEAALTGHGIALLPTFIAGPHIKAGRLETLLKDWALPEIAIHVLYPPNRHLTPKVRALIDFLVERFRKPPWEVD
jgi:DNA-binding transcriptional LysR family regulator